MKISQIRHKTRIRRLKVVYYIGGSPTKKTNKRQRRIGRRAKKSIIKTIRNQTPTINLKTALLQIRTYATNKKKR